MEHELKMAVAQNKQLKYEFKMKACAADHNAQLELLRLQIQLAQVNAAAGATPAVVPTASTSTIVPATPVPTYRPPLQSYNIHQTLMPSSDDGSFSGSVHGFGSKTDSTGTGMWMMDENFTNNENFTNENTDYSSIL